MSKHHTWLVYFFVQKEFMYTWQRFGGYEVSSKGDKTYSAFNAIMPDGRSIECHYQLDCKGYQPGGTDWRLGKGKPPLIPMSKQELLNKYVELWRVWSRSHLYEMIILKEHADKNNKILSDRFATTEINQANALSIILNEIYNPVLK